MAKFKLYECVRVVGLRSCAGAYDGWRVNRRAPKLGDRGTVVEVLRQDRFVVECVEENGETAWLGDFAPEELAVAPTPDGAGPPDEAARLAALGPDYGAELQSGDVVSARLDLVRGPWVVPVGRHGVVDRVESPGDAGVVHVRFPVIVNGQKKLKTMTLPRRAVSRQVRSDDVLRDPNHPRGTKAEGEWASLEKDELVSLGARLKKAVQVPPPHVFAGRTVRANRYGRVVQCVERQNDGVIYVINVTLPDPGSHQGYRFTNLEVRREEFVLEDPAKADERQSF